MATDSVQRGVNVSEGTETASARSEPTSVDASTEVMLVGTFGGGGIHQYVEHLEAELEGRIDVSVHDMYSDSKGDGLRWAIRSLLLSLVAAFRFPFRDPPDLVHVHASQRFSFYRASPYVFVARHLWNRPVIFHVHGSSFDEFLTADNPLVRALQNAVFARCDRIVVLSEYWQRILTSRVDAGKVRVIPNAVSVEDYDPRYDREVPLLVFVSNMFERKGILELVAAIDDLAGSTPEFEVAIAGTGPLSDAPADLAERHEFVQYHGYVSEAKKRQLLSEGTIYTLPTYAEGLPIALLEGMAGGNAAVTTAVGAIPEVVDEEGGVVIEPGDPDALADALRSLIESPERVGSMGRHNRRLAREKYSWDVVVDQMLDVYEETLAATEREPGAEPESEP